MPKLNSSTITAQEKLSRGGMPLSEVDIQALLKDPNSWLSQQLAIAQMDAQITKLYIHELFATYYHFQQDREVEYLERSKSFGIAQRLQERMDSRGPSLAYNDETTLSFMLENLLSLPQSNMTANQLDLHYTNIMMTIQNQMNEKIGSTITLKDGSTLINPMTTIPPISVTQLLKYNPTLASTVEEQAKNEKTKKDFVKFNVNFAPTLLHLQLAASVCEKNGIKTSNVSVFTEVANFFAQQYKAVKDATSNLVEHLTENMERSADIFIEGIKDRLNNKSKPNTSEPPALFGYRDSNQNHPKYDSEVSPVPIQKRTK